MTLGFYYHIPIVSRNNRLFVPGYLGVFLDALASEVKTLYLFMHDGNQRHLAEADFELQQKNIVFISMGNLSPAWHRHFFHRHIFSRISRAADICDALVIRAPTPLAPFFKNYIRKPRLIFMIVGDYLEGAKQFKVKSLRDWVMIQYLKRNDSLFRQEMRHTDVLVNSPALFNKYEPLSRTIHLIRTTTLTRHDFFERSDTCQNNVIELLYTGRIEAAKGLFELVASVAQLRSRHINVRLNIVGWEADSKKSVEKALMEKAQELTVEKFIVFHNRKKIGDELNEMYRNADIYVIPSHHEGFPRTIWEAMANSLPVVATRVGAIPDYLTHEKNAFLIQPGNVQEITLAIERIIQDSALRQKMIQEGLYTARENTLEYQTKILVNKIKDVAIT